jgi:hypothetical protein
MSNVKAQPMEQHIIANAELVRKVAAEQLEIAVQYDEAGVRWLEKYIDGQRERDSAEVKAKLPNTLGSFLGECIRQTYGGHWVQDPAHGWQVKINDAVSVFPFNKVEKHLANEDGDSVLGLFTAIPGMIGFASKQALRLEATAGPVTAHGGSSGEPRAL